MKDMEFAGKVWRLLVGVKDALVLMVLLLFFGLLYAALAGRAPAPAQAGALLVRLNGTLVEEPQAQDPASVLLGNGEAPAQTRARDVERALALAAGDSQVKAVVVDLAGFSGSSGLVTLEEVGAAMDRVRAAGKPVLVYGSMLED
ncbi:MAG TPA: signal peptide peptidase SppA, partial [Novosphingobium sp.]|nr:signal peptide peptidase SppA [Novosphingobium sp.]